MTIERQFQRTVPAAYHIAAASFVTWCAWMATSRPEAYAAAMQEDRFIEWLTVFAFAAAAVVVLARAVRARRFFDALVGVFLLFVAGEEMSWGQRLFGLTPPAYFLEHNTQQEMNIHNFADLFGSPRGPFTLVLLGYGVALPLAASIARVRPLLARLGATPPPLAACAWFVMCVALLTWYPFRFTGEWTELLAGSAFLVSSGVRRVTLAALLPVGMVTAIALETYSARGLADPRRVACAVQETRSLAAAVRPELSLSGNAHKRVWTFVDEGSLSGSDVRRALEQVSCDIEQTPVRRRFAVDPWGTAYWIRVRRAEEGTVVSVYSFGPNRRRDDSPGSDDIRAP